MGYAGPVRRAEHLYADLDRERKRRDPTVPEAWRLGEGRVTPTPVPARTRRLDPTRSSITASLERSAVTACVIRPGTGNGEGTVEWHTSTEVRRGRLSDGSIDRGMLQRHEDY